MKSRSLENVSYIKFFPYLNLINFSCVQNPNSLVNMTNQQKICYVAT